MGIEVRIKKNFGGFTLDVDIKSESRRIGILGASGCGKSMTLKTIAGIEKPDEGYIRVGDKVLYDSSARINLKPQQRNIGYLFQNYALFPTMTVEKNIEAGLKGTKEENKKRVEEMIRKFQLDGLAKRLPGQLSGGQQQRVALARIMAYGPDVIMLDEPFSALDVFLKDRLQKEMKEMLDDYPGIVILVSHSRDEIYRFSDELIVMDHGRPIVHGGTKEVFRNPIYKEAARLTGCKNFANVVRIDEHSAEIVDWGIRIQTKKPIPEDITCIGYRAHEFIPVWDKSGDQDSADNPGNQGNSEILSNQGNPEKTGNLNKPEKPDAPRIVRRELENLIKVIEDGSAQLPFENNYYFKPDCGMGDSQMICWFVQRDQQHLIEKKGLPQYLGLKEEHILLLK